MKITIECPQGDNTIYQNRIALDTTRQATLHHIFVNKRKLIGSESMPQHQNTEIVKRVHKTSPIGGLDLNLPAEDSDGNSENDCVSETSLVCIQDLFDQLNETVVFRQLIFMQSLRKCQKTSKIASTNSFTRIVC